MNRRGRHGLRQRPTPSGIASPRRYAAPSRLGILCRLTTFFHAVCSVTSSVTKAFRELLLQLPRATQEQAARTYALWRTEPYHNSLQCKRVSQGQPIYSVRIGLGDRPHGLGEGGQGDWFGV